MSPAIGTLGLIVEALEDNRMVFAVTAYHVVFNSPLQERPAEVGQPTPSHSCTACCRGVIGKFFGGYHSGIVEPPPVPRRLDYALIRLDAGLEWLNEVKEIGVLFDFYELKVSDVVPLTYQVRKRGCITHLTGGIVQAIGVARPPLPVIPPGATADQIDSIMSELFNEESIAIRPNPIAANPAAPVIFATHGDSGSALVNDDNKVVGLLWGGHPSGHTAPTDRFGYGWGVPITWITDDFKQRLGLTMRIVPTAGTGIVNTVPEFAEAGSYPSRRDQSGAGSGSERAGPIVPASLAPPLGRVERNHPESASRRYRLAATKRLSAAATGGPGPAGAQSAVADRSRRTPGTRRTPGLSRSDRALCE